MDETADATDGVVSRAYLNKIELGHSRHVSVRVFRALRAALGLSVDEGVFITGDPWAVVDELDETGEGAA